MYKGMFFLVMLMILTIFPFRAYGDEGLKAWWTFDDVRVERVEVKMVRGETFVPRERLSYIKENVSGEENELFGKYYEVVDGVKGKAVLLDGYTAYVQIPETEPYRVTGDFSVEGWIALGAYPKHWCPIVDHQRDVAEGYFNGYFLGVDAMGRLMFRIAANGRNVVLFSAETVKLNEWTHVAGVYNPDAGLRIYINGERAGRMRVRDEFSPLQEGRMVPLMIGKSREKHRPYGTIRPEGTMEVNTYLDGIIDELKIYDRALSYEEISESYDDNKTSAEPQLPKRILPAGPEGPGKFGAINTHLKYYPGWDAPWHYGDNSDVVVRFDETPCKFVFWRGTNFIPHWVSDGIWFNNGFNEGWNEHGSCEPMSDKKCLHAYAKIVESNDARVVVQWRYGLIDNWYRFAFVDPETGWGDWTEETFTIYPDMVGVREDKLISNAPRAAHEWQESMMVMGPGQRPDEVLEFAALSLANMEGKSHTYSWEHETPPFLPEDPPNANIQVVNTKTKYRPFSIIRPQDKPKIDIYAGEIRRDVCVFPWWNHWPVAPRPTDGRWAMYDDRASHASLSHWNWGAYEETDNTMTKLMLNGMTTKTVEELIPLTKSWSNPAKLEVDGAGFESEGYDPTEMAYQLTCEGAGKLEMSLNASEDSPLVNPAFVIKNWGEAGAKLKLEREEIQRGMDFRYGHRYRLEGTDLIVWLRTESVKPVNIEIMQDK
jgi:hypothetical protein